MDSIARMSVVILSLIALVNFPCAATDAGAGAAGESVQRQKTPVLPGSSLRIEDAAKKADVVQVALLVGIEPAGVFGPLGIKRCNCQLRPGELLRGTGVTGPSQLDINVDREEAPQQQKSYIFFIANRRGESPEVIKVMVAWPEQIEIVRRAVAATAPEERKPEERSPRDKSANPSTAPTADERGRS